MLDTTTERRPTDRAPEPGDEPPASVDRRAALAFPRGGIPWGCSLPRAIGLRPKPSAGCEFVFQKVQSNIYQDFGRRRP